MNDITSYAFFPLLTAMPCIDEIWLYGSRARGNHHDRSDFDVAFVCPRASNEEWLKIVDIIEEADTLYKIDYVRFDELPDSEPLKNLILHDKKILFKRA
jgi:predicted nucleotidyltransferase